MKRRRSSLLLHVKILFFVLVSAGRPALAEPSRPAIIVPGILGSKLCDGDQVVWGSALSFKNFYKLDLLDERNGHIKPCGIIDSISVLGPFWKIDAYGPLISHLNSLNYEKDKNLFLFDYDWRLDNRTNAKRLKELYDRIDAPEIDIIAHSMGGIIASIFVKQYPSTRVRKIMFLGTPFLGSMNTMSMLLDGWGGFENFLAGGLDQIRKTTLSFPSIYQLLPNYSACCKQENEGSYVNFDIMQSEAWKMHRLLPPEFMSGEKWDYFSSSLVDAISVKKIVNAPMPDKIKIVRVVSDIFATKNQIYLRQQREKTSSWSFSKNRGDETVPAWSAAENESSLSNTTPSFGAHGNIFNDKTVKSLIEREFLDLASPRAVPLRLFRTSTGELKPFEWVELSSDQSAVRVGQRVSYELKIKWSAAPQKDLLHPHLRIDDGSSEAAMQEITTQDDLDNFITTYATIQSAPSVPGTWRAIVDGEGNVFDNFLVLTTF